MRWRIPSRDPSDAAPAVLGSALALLPPSAAASGIALETHIERHADVATPGLLAARGRRRSGRLVQMPRHPPGGVVQPAGGQEPRLRPEWRSVGAPPLAADEFDQLARRAIYGRGQSVNLHQLPRCMGRGVLRVRRRPAARAGGARQHHHAIWSASLRVAWHLSSLPTCGQGARWSLARGLLWLVSTWGFPADARLSPPELTRSNWR